MGSGNVFESLFRAQTSINKMVAEGKRNPKNVLRYLQLIIARPDFAAVINQPPAAQISVEPSAGWVAEWERFYGEVFARELDFNEIPVPEEKPGFGWVVFVAEGLTLNQVWARCRDRFPCHSYLGDDLDKAVTRSNRTSEQAYARRFRNRVEADAELKNLSDTGLVACDVRGITLLERMLLELWYHWKSGGGHLDLLNITLCAGSRCAFGYVPGAYWDGNQFELNDYDPDSQGGSIRARAEVSKKEPC